MTIIVVRTGAGVGVVTATVAVPLLNPVKVAVAVIAPALVGFTSLAKIPAESVVPLVLTLAPLRATVAPLAAVIFVTLTLLVLFTVKVTVVDEPAVIVVGFAATANVNTGNA
ncbi:Uncharacterised protein [uncultured archaeon]|nr:Uncharacterised protein [uncultured archaeon]